MKNHIPASVTTVCDICGLVHNEATGQLGISFRSKGELTLTYDGFHGSGTTRKIEKREFDICDSCLPEFNERLHELIKK